MSAARRSSEELLKQVVETFWETIPPYWHRVRAHIRQVAVDRHHITVEQFQILRHIRKGDCSVSGLAEAKNTSRPAISQVVDVLVNKGLVTRTQDVHDRRHVRLDLTARGDGLLDAIFEDANQWMTQKLASLGDDELRAMIQGMEFLKKALPA